MAIDTASIRQQISKLRKSIKKAPEHASPEDVHKLRTRARRFESISDSLTIGPKRKSRDILRPLKRIRKKAGRVRDMDMLTSHLSSVHAEGEEECLVQLFEHLGAQRHKHARRLQQLAEKYGPRLRKQLKTVMGRVEKLEGRKNGKVKNAKFEAATSALQLSGELSHPVTLNRSNLHPFRLKVKELRYVLQMAEGGGQNEFVKALGKCKDAIGEWHDWEELIAMAKRVLGHGRNCKLLGQLTEISGRKCDEALAVVNRLRKTYTNNHKKRQSGETSSPIVKAVSSISESRRKRKSA